MKELIIIFLGMFIATNINAKELYTIDNIKLKNKNNKVIADITKGTKLKIIKQSDNMSYVKIEGWSYEDEPNLDIFPDIGVTVILTSIKEKYVKNRIVKSKKEDSYEEVWLKNSISGWVPTNMLTNKFSNLWKIESSLASERCGACHSEPRANDYEAVAFPSLINSMKETAGLSDMEESFVVNYYQKNKIYKIK